MAFEKLPSLTPTRISSVDIARGIVMLIMVLDHTRDWFGEHEISALDVANTSGPLFFSRWITHFCAPSFVFLSGVSAYIKLQRMDAPTLSRFLLTRGIYLIILEQTFLRCFGWYFNFDYHFMNANVLWGIGGSMILLSALVRFPRRAILIVGIVVIVSHDLATTGITVSENSFINWPWVMLIKGGNLSFLGDHNFYVSYPMLPWFGIMAFGFGLGNVILAGDKSEKVLLVCAMLLLTIFIIFRGFFSYGDPSPWHAGNTLIRSIMSFVNVEKYPPSFLFTTMTVSVTLIILSSGNRLPGFVKSPLIVLGKSPLLFYVAHIMFIHALAVMIALIRYGHAEWLYKGPGIFWDTTLPGHPAGYGLSLPWVYLISSVVIGILYLISKKINGRSIVIIVK